MTTAQAPPPTARPIPLSAPWFGEPEAARVADALRGRTAGDGPFGRRVERRLAEMLGAQRVLLTTSCTHALELALLALGIGPGQEVICPSFTFVSTANAILRVGARPVFADIEEKTLGLDPADVERRVTARRPPSCPCTTPAWLPTWRASSTWPEAAGSAGDRGRGPGAGGQLGADGPSAPWATLGCLSFHETKNVSLRRGRRPRARRRGRWPRRGGDHPREGHQPQRLPAGRGGQVHLGGRGHELHPLGRAGGRSRRPARSLRRRSRPAAPRVVARYQAGLAEWARAQGVRIPRDAARARAEPPHLLLSVPGRSGSAIAAMAA